MPLVQSMVVALAVVCTFVRVGDFQVKVVLFGATGMVGQGVLRECLLDPDVEGVLAVVRNASLPQHDKLRELVHQDVYDLAAIEDKLSGYDACFFCLGVSSVGMKEETYRRVTYDLTVSVAKSLSQAQPDNDLHLRVWGRNRQHGARAKHVGTGEGQNGKRAIADALQGCVPVSPCLHSAASWNSHKDQMVWGGLRLDETPLSVVEGAFPELRDNDRMRRSRHAEHNEATFSQTCP